MPNWCSNRLSISGPADDVAALRAAVLPGDDGHPALLSSLHPMPDELVGTSSPNRDATPEQVAYLTATYGAEDWYAWATSTAGWGTKWGDCHTDEVTVEPGLVVYLFDTAWSPPIVGTVHVSARFPSLTFVLEYAEPGMDFSGTAVVREGLLVEDAELDSCTSDFALECGYGVDEDEDDEWDAADGGADAEGVGVADDEHVGVLAALAATAAAAVTAVATPSDEQDPTVTGTP